MNYYLSKIMMYHLVNQMDRDGHSITRIAEYYELNWRTVKHLLSISEEQYLYELEKGRSRVLKLDSFQDFVKEKLRSFPDTSAAQMHDLLKEHHPWFPQVSQKTVFNFVQFVRNEHNIPKVEPIREYACVAELAYGLQGQVDFGFYNMKTTLGKTKKVQFFTFVLARSRYKYILFTDTPFTTETVIQAHEKAFEALRGIPAEIVYDQDRLFLVSENLGDLIMTSGFKGYPKERGFRVWFCRKADPESKGKVENVVKYVKQNFLYNRLFRDLDTLNDDASDWLHRTANALPHGTTKKIPIYEYCIEEPFLIPWYPIIIPQADYPAYAVRKDNTISWKSNLYSLPLGTYKGPGTQVLVSSTKLELILLDQDKNELCRHQVSQLTGQKILKTDHGRDKRLVIAEMMEEFCALMIDKDAAMEWILQIKEDKPRYIRDQIQLLITIVGSIGQPLAGQALDYCRNHQIISAGDFKAVAVKLKQQAPVLQEAKIISLNPLNGQNYQKTMLDPDKSDLQAYETLFK